MSNPIFNRTELLLGSDRMELLARTKVIIFGIGGVGSWCAEGLIRTGIGHLTIVDSDLVGVTNINRQMMATTKTIGQPKVEALRDRLLEINPGADIQAVQRIYSEDTADSFGMGEYDYIIDAVDSLRHKASLILRACRTEATFFSSMGAALKIDPTRIQVAEFWEVRGCPLASILRKKLRHDKTLPSRPFLCVFDDEVLENKGVLEDVDTDMSLSSGTDDPASLGDHWSSTKAVINGTTAYITAIFGFTLSGLVIQDLYHRLPR